MLSKHIKLINKNIEEIKINFYFIFKANAWNEAILSIRQAFYNFMLALVNNYIPFFLYSQTFDEKASSADIFDSNSYFKIFQDDHLKFMRDFTTKTMVKLQ